MSAMPASQGASSDSTLPVSQAAAMAGCVGGCGEIEIPGIAAGTVLAATGAIVIAVFAHFQCL